MYCSLFLQPLRRLVLGHFLKYGGHAVARKSDTRILSARGSASMV
jgi:hypothetical protein